MRIFQKMSQTLCFVSLLLTCAKLSAQNEKPRIRNVVLKITEADRSGIVM
jgi:hypothetical protein